MGNKKIVIALFALFLTAIITASNIVSATERQRTPYPPPARDATGSVRDVQSDLEELSEIDIGPNAPTGIPGSTNQPVPRFSGVNTPWILNSAADRSVEIYDDAVVHGLTDVRGGLINNADVNPRTVTMSLDESTPPSGNVSRNTSNNVTTKFSLTNDSDLPTTLSRITVTRVGDATSSDIDVKLIDDESGLTLGTAVNLTAEGKATFNFVKGIAAGETVFFTIKTDVSATAVYGNTYRFNIADDADVTVAPGLTVRGAPVTGNQFTISAPTTMTIISSAVPAGRTLTKGTGVDEEILRFSLRNDSASSRTVSAITVTKTGAADSADLDLKLFDASAGTQIGSTVTNIDASGRVTFSTASLISLNAGETKNYSVKTVVSASAVSGRTFSFNITNNNDVTATGLTVTGAPANGNTFTIGSANGITMALVSSIGGSVAQGATITATRFSLTNNTASSATFSGLTFNRSGSAGGPLTVFLSDTSGNTISGSSFSSASPGSATRSFTSFAYTVIPAGATRSFDIRVNVPGGTTGNFSMNVLANADVSIGGVPVNGAPVTGSVFTISTPSPTLELTRVLPPAVLSASNDQELLRFTARTTSATGTVSKITIKKEGSVLNESYTNFRLQELSGALWNPVASAPSITDVDPSPTAQRWAVDFISLSESVSTTATTYRLIANVSCTNDVQIPNPTVDFRIENISDISTTISNISLSQFATIASRSAPTCPSLAMYQHINDLVYAATPGWFNDIPLLVFGGSTTDSMSTLQNVILSQMTNLTPPAGTRNSTNFSVGNIRLLADDLGGAQIGQGSYNPSTNKITLTYNPAAAQRQIGSNSTRNYVVKANACDHSSASGATALPEAPWLYFNIAGPNDVNIAESSVVKSVRPWSYTGRQIARCPASPTVTANCGFGAYPNPANISVQWTTRPNNNTYAVEIDDDADWTNGFWRTNYVINTTNTSLTNSNVSAVAPRTGMLQMQQGRTYKIRVRYNELGINSNTATLTPSTCTPPAPILSTSCTFAAGESPTINIAWSGNGLNNTDYWIDIDNNEPASTLFKISSDGGNGFWNKHVGNVLTTTDSGFNGYGGASGVFLVSEYASTYKVRVYFPRQGIHSAVGSIYSPGLCIGYKPSSVALAEPEMQSSGLLDFFNPPTANANFIETASATASTTVYPAGMRNPVTVYDDFYVHGNDRESGNAYITGNLKVMGNISGNITTTGTLNIGDVDNNNQITGNLRILSGNLEVPDGQFKVGLPDSPYLIVNETGIGTLHIKANSIGRFYTNETPTWGTGSANVSCDSGDVTTSCNGYSKTTSPISGIRFRDNLCEVLGSSASDLLKAQAMCFNPNY